MFKIDTVKTVADVLYEKKLITADQLSAIKFENVNTGKGIEQIIKERGYTNSEDFAEAFGEVYGIPFINLTPDQADPKLLELVPITLAKKYKLVPFELKENKLSVAMVDPLDLQTIDFIERKTELKVIPYITTEKIIEKVLEEQKGKELGEEIHAAMEEISQTTLKIEEGSSDLNEQTIRDAPIARIVSMILETAVKTIASDVHIEPGEDRSRLRYRVDGILIEKMSLPKEMHDSVVARIKILAKMKIDEKRIPQDGRFKVQVGRSETDLRISTLPTIYGEKVVIRLLKEEGVIYSFRDLGVRGLGLKRLEEACLQPNGMILVTGPTGSGKTVTLASALSKLNTARVNIVTLEDPVEIRVDGVNQVQINPQAGLTFSSGLRSFLRHGETAELAVHAALTGHLVLSTLHTNSASGAIPRLLDMGVESFLLASTLNAVLAQRLIRRICKDCIEEYTPPAEVQESIDRTLSDISSNKTLMLKDPEIAKSVKKFSSDKVHKVARGKGCPKCANTGYRGRVGIFELLPMTDTVAHMTLERTTANKIEAKAIEEGMLTLVQDGYLRVAEGATTIEEVMRVAKQ
jgi:type IV pilus assembly protein PilB